LSCNETYSLSVMTGHLKAGVSGNRVLVGGGIEIELIVHQSIIQSGSQRRVELLRYHK